MNTQDIRQKVITVLVAVKKPSCPITASEANLALHGYTDRDKVPLLTALENEFSIDLEDMTIMNAVTVEDIVSHVEQVIADSAKRLPSSVRDADDKLEALHPTSFNRLPRAGKVAALQSALGTFAEDAPGNDLEAIRVLVDARLLMLRRHRATQAAQAKK